MMELERALVVLGHTDLCPLGNLAESVDQPLMLLVLRTPSFHVAETFGGFEFLVGFLDDKVRFIKLRSWLDI